MAPVYCGRKSMKDINLLRSSTLLNIKWRRWKKPVDVEAECEEGPRFVGCLGLIFTEHLPCARYFTSCLTYLLSFNLYDSFLEGGCFCASFTGGEAETQTGKFFKVAYKGQDLSTVLIVSSVFLQLLFSLLLTEVKKPGMLLWP